MQKRLDEISKSEEKLTELNQELSKQISDMVKEFDLDKREAVERYAFSSYINLSRKYRK